MTGVCVQRSTPTTARRIARQGHCGRGRASRPGPARHSRESVRFLTASAPAPHDGWLGMFLSVEDITVAEHARLDALLASLPLSGEEFTWSRFVVDLERQRGRPIRFVTLPRGIGVSGAWLGLARDVTIPGQRFPLLRGDYILTEDTHPVRQRHVQLHEIGHMIADDGEGCPGGVDRRSALLLPLVKTAFPHLPGHMHEKLVADMLPRAASYDSEVSSAERIAEGFALRFAGAVGIQALMASDPADGTEMQRVFSARLGLAFGAEALVRA
jgi:hypothetical protein